MQRARPRKPAGGLHTRKKLQKPNHHAAVGGEASTSGRLVVVEEVAWTATRLHEHAQRGSYARTLPARADRSYRAVYQCCQRTATTCLICSDSRCVGCALYRLVVSTAAARKAEPILWPCRVRTHNFKITKSSASAAALRCTWQLDRRRQPVEWTADEPQQWARLALKTCWQRRWPR